MSRVAVSLLLSVLLSPTAVSAAATPQEPAHPAYIVTLQPGVDAKAFAKKVGAVAQRTYAKAINGFVATLSQGQVDRLERDPVVRGVARDDATYELQRQQANPPHDVPCCQSPQEVDDGVRRVGGLESPTAEIDGTDERVDADVAIIDSGIASEHDDLNVVGGRDCTGNGTWEDFYGHGTLVGGIAASLDNAIGTVGIAPGARLWAVRVVEGKAPQEKIRPSALVCAFDWVTASAGVLDVANISITGANRMYAPCGRDAKGKVRDPVHAAVCAAVAAGVTITAAAGNDGVDAAVETPAAYPEVITVSAYADYDGQPGGLAPEECLDLEPLPEEDDTLAFFSNFGAVVDIAAPGVCIEGPVIPDGAGGYGVGDGTSLSAPHVAGAGALYRATHPGATPAQVRSAILAAAEPGPLADDPDAFAEGLLDVSGF
jgi:subtilisin